jgi:MerR family transcriptional regulator, light-induced transcriptional regulator
MNAAGPLLTSTEVARLLGVTAATVKRWADSGRLECARTAGRHRRFASEVVERFRKAHAPDGGEPIRFVDRLLEAPDPIALQGELLRERARLGSWWRVADWLAPELEELGARWESGRIGIVEEHVASDGLLRALARAAETLPLRRDAPRVLLAAAEGEEHLLGLALVDVCAREEGWRTLWAGRRTPAGEVIRQVEAGAVEVVVLSASVAADPAALAAEAAAVGQVCARRGVHLVVGGRGRWPEPLRHGRVLRSFEAFRRWMEEVEAVQPRRV